MLELLNNASSVAVSLKINLGLDYIDLPLYLAQLKLCIPLGTRFLNSNEGKAITTTIQASSIVLPEGLQKLRRDAQTNYNSGDVNQTVFSRAMSFFFAYVYECDSDEAYIIRAKAFVYG